ncbi:family 10 glycosylhydrolase [Maribacter litopenaei]|uniref:Family 10 glycosylhydrolase n=1 Tax=Maribacter litopenaei TaxID=2976127 RepID=A0ABY5YCH2_9FLAO|nr:family 10 glycosylhydrolase [Maribacter litopenaei]UWX56027.1 family 10 glycosylhydrolase [Maribacter litopenaei]
MVKELTISYNIDGVHYDDYFYPYTIKDEVFNDSITYYNCSQPQQTLADWRRSNVDSLIKKSYQTIKEHKPWVQFGVSPFGVWKNKSTDPRGSDTQAGQTTYENLYADPLLWMEKGWLDYIAPQIYWSPDMPVASHRTLVEWWSNNSSNSNIYIGNGAYKVRNNSDQSWKKRKNCPTNLNWRGRPRRYPETSFSVQNP